MNFTQADRDSNTWHKLKEHLEERRQLHRIRNDGKMSEADRNFLIGQIAEINALLRLEDVSPVIPRTSAGG